MNAFCFQVFRKFGVEKFDPTNEPFDPHRHNAVFKIPDNSKPADTVAVVLKVPISAIQLFFMYSLQDEELWCSLMTNINYFNL